MRIFVNAESLQAGSRYIELAVRLATSRPKKPRKLQINWIRESRRFANGAGIAWVRNHQPDDEAVIRDEVERIERDLLARLEG
jgi:hypothetical protein